MHEWFTAAELAEFKLPDFPDTKRGVQKRILAENWKSRPREGRGGGFEYHVSNFNRDQKVALCERLAAGSFTGTALVEGHVTQEIRALTAQRQGLTLNAWQCRVMEARAAICDEINFIAAAIGRSRAVDHFMRHAQAGQLKPVLAEHVKQANAKSGAIAKNAKGVRKLSRRSIYRWLSAYERGGAAALAPELTRTPDDAFLAWAP